MKTKSSIKFYFQNSYFSHQPDLIELFKKEFPDLYEGLMNFGVDIDWDVQVRFNCLFESQFKSFSFKGSGLKRELIPPILPDSWDISIRLIPYTTEEYMDDVYIPYSFCPHCGKSTAVLNEWINRMILEEVELIKQSMELQKTLQKESLERKKIETKEAELVQLQKLAKKYNKKIVERNATS